MRYSFIVPVYNGENFIEECLDSILAQTIKDFEIVVVDDGSKDESGKICDRYAADNPNIHVFHNENGGVSAARNYGIEHSSGEYITFVDCDDTVSPYMLEYAEKSDVDYDIIVFRHTRESREELCSSYEETKPERGDRQAVLDRTIYDGKNSGEYLYNAVSKIYKRKVIENVRFVRGISIGEDKLFGFSAFLNADEIYFCDRKMYYCRAHSGSVMHRYSKNYNEVAERTFEEYERVISDCRDSEHYRKMLSLRAVKVLNNIAVLELCSRGNKQPYKERRARWSTIMNNSLAGKYFAECDGKGLNSADSFYLWAYKHSFLRINLMTKYKPFKALEYSIYRLLRK